MPNSDLFKFSNPDRAEDDLQIAKNQTYNGQVISSQPTFSHPTAAKENPNQYGKYMAKLTLRGESSEQILFGRFKHKSSCCLLICSCILSIIFCAICIDFFSEFDTGP